MYKRQHLQSKFNYRESVIPYLLYFLFKTGFRVGEGMAVCWSDIDFENKTVRTYRRYIGDKQEFAPVSYTHLGGKMRRNILLGFVLSIFFFPLVVAGAIEPSLPNSSTNIGESTTKPSSSSSIVPNTNNGSPFLPNNNFNIVEFDKNTNKPKLVDPADNAKKALDNARKSREAKEALKKKEAESRKLTYDNYKSKMSDLTSKVYFDKKFFGFDSNMNYFFNSIVQAIFWLSKFIFTIIAGIYNAVEGMSDVSTLLNNVIGNSSNCLLYTSMFMEKDFLKNLILLLKS